MSNNKPIILSPAWFRKKIRDEGSGLISELIRCNPLFINRAKLRNAKYLHVGCGPLRPQNFINVDRKWGKGVDLCWDITKKPYPIKDGSLDGIFTEHVLEHIPYVHGKGNLAEFHRMLKPGGVLRIIMPDAELYMRRYVEKRSDPTVQIPFGENDPNPMVSINRIFYSWGHQFLWDHETLFQQLKEAGFSNFGSVAFKEGSNPDLLLDTEKRRSESFYVEAIR